MTKSMLRPGKQHNFRVTVEATWTEAFNRLADKHKWSANKTMNILLHNALNMMEMTDETITVDVLPHELDTILRLRNNPPSLSAEPVRQAAPVSNRVTPTVRTEPEAPRAQMPTPPSRITPKEEVPSTPIAEEENLSPLEKARRQFSRSTLS